MLLNLYTTTQVLKQAHPIPSYIKSKILDEGECTYVFTYTYVLCFSRSLFNTKIKEKAKQII